MKKSLKYAIVSILAILALSLIISCGGGGGVENAPAAAPVLKAFHISGTNESFDTLKETVTFLQKISTETPKAVSTGWTIVLTTNVTDAGATISGISLGVTINFQSFTYTLSSGSEGIVIDNGDNAVELSGGTIQVSTGATLASGTSSVITAKSNITLSGTKVDVSKADVDAVQTLDCEMTIEGNTSITVKDDKKTIVAGVGSSVSVTSESVVLTGGLSIENAVLDLGTATLNLTQNIEKIGDDAVFITETAKIEITGNDVDEEQLEEAKHNHKFATAWTHDETHHWHEATCEHAEARGSYQEHIWDEGTVVLDSTFTEEGIKKYTCICGAEKEEVIPKKDPADSGFAPAFDNTLLYGVISYEKTGNTAVTVTLKNINPKADCSTSRYEWFIDNEASACFTETEKESSSFEYEVTDGKEHVITCQYSNMYKGIRVYGSSSIEISL